MRLVNPIGFNRQVKRAWLDQAVDGLMRQESPGDIEADLVQTLRNVLSGEESQRGSLQKTITIIKRIWLYPPDKLIASRYEALQKSKLHAKDQRLIYHWMMTCGAYPFFADVATNCGRLLRLQQEFSASDLASRMTEKYGDKENVRRCTRYALRAMVEWGTLVDAKLGRYKGANIADVSSVEELRWIVRTRIRCSPSNGIFLSVIQQDPMLFPFRLAELRAVLSEDSEIQVQSQGPDRLLQLRPKSVTL